MGQYDFCLSKSNFIAFLTIKENLIVLYLESLWFHIHWSMENHPKYVNNVNKDIFWEVEFREW